MKVLPSTLGEWLAWQEQQSAQPIVLGLERVLAVARRLRLPPPARQTITVAGTNGKGSSVTLLEKIYLAAGYRVGAYRSPHLLRYNERGCIQGREIDDAAWCKAFARIEQARGEVSLTYFEYGTLAIWLLFAEAELDVAVLEVGLGGRLDAVNAMDADVALVTTISLDHTDWLGPDRDSIGREKAGVFRAHHPVVCADPQPPQSLLDQAAALQCPLYRQGQDFQAQVADAGWHWRGWDSLLEPLPLPALPGAHQLRNAAGVLAVIRLLQTILPVSAEAIRTGLQTLSLPGRFERSWVRTTQGRVECILDVAHNEESVQALHDNLRDRPVVGRTIAVFSALGDKPLEAMVNTLREQVQYWHFAGLPGLRRGLNMTELRQRLVAGCGDLPADYHDRVVDAYRHACAQADTGDRLVVFGSFYTIEAVRRLGDE